MLVEVMLLVWPVDGVVVREAASTQSASLNRWVTPSECFLGQEVISSIPGAWKS